MRERSRRKSQRTEVVRLRVFVSLRPGYHVTALRLLIEQIKKDPSVASVRRGKWGVAHTRYMRKERSCVLRLRYTPDPSFDLAEAATDWCLWAEARFAKEAHWQHESCDHL